MCRCFCGNMRLLQRMLIWHLCQLWHNSSKMELVTAMDTWKTLVFSQRNLWPKFLTKLRHPQNNFDVKWLSTILANFSHFGMFVQVMFWIDLPNCDFKLLKLFPEFGNILFNLLTLWLVESYVTFSGLPKLHNWLKK